MAQVQVQFTPPTPAPANGYKVKYRISGSGAAYSEVSGSSSPITIPGVDVTKDYEGTVRSICNLEGYESSEVAWSAAKLYAAKITFANTNNNSGLEFSIRWANASGAPTNLVYSGFYTSDPVVIYLTEVPAGASVQVNILSAHSIVFSSCNGVNGPTSGTSAYWSGLNGNISINLAV